jgi:hypothetical protein
LEYVPHEDLIDLVGVDARAPYGLLHGNGTERGCRNLDENTAQRAHRRTNGADDDGLFHAQSLLLPRILHGAALQLLHDGGVGRVTC